MKQNPTSNSVYDVLHRFREFPSGKYRVVPPGEIEIGRGEKIAIHITHATHLALIVVGADPVGIKGGTIGKWMDGRLVAGAVLGTRWIDKLYWTLVRRMAVSGDDDQRMWAAHLLLDGERKLEVVCREQRTNRQSSANSGKSGSTASGSSRTEAR